MLPTAENGSVWIMQQGSKPQLVPKPQLWLKNSLLKKTFFIYKYIESRNQWNKLKWRFNTFTVFTCLVKSCVLCNILTQLYKLAQAKREGQWVDLHEQLLQFSDPSTILTFKENALKLLFKINQISGLPISEDVVYEHRLKMSCIEKHGKVQVRSDYVTSVDILYMSIYRGSVRFASWNSLFNWKSTTWPL